MKSIDTLVTDIKKLIQYGSLSITDEAYETLGRDMASKVRKCLEDGLREATEERQVLRMSNIGRADLYLWHLANAKEGDKPTRAEQFGPDRLLAFVFGDLIEELLFWFAEQTGHTVTDRQRTITVDGVVGHTDGRIDGMPIDTKSAADRSFLLKFVKEKGLLEDDPYGYLAQLAGYSEETDDVSAFLAANKSTGEIVLSKYTKKELPDIKERIKHVKEVIAKKEPPSERCYDTVKHGESDILGAGCSRCPFKHPCWDNVSNDGAGLRVFDYADGPKYFVQLASKPRVEERKSSLLKKID